MDFLGKKYKLYSSENFDEFLKAQGANLIARKIVGALTPVVELTKDGDNSFVFKTVSTFRTMESKFQPGVEAEGSRPDGTKVKNLYTFDGNNVLRQREISENGNEVVYIRTFTADEMRMEMTYKDIVCRRIYKAV